MSEVFERMEIHFVNTTFTREPLTFSATLENGTDLDGARAVLAGMVNSGWEIGAVHAATDMDFTGEYTVIPLDDVDDIINVAEHLIENDYAATRILGYGEIYGWDVDNILSETYNDAVYYEGDSPADIAMELFYEMNEDLMTKINETVFLSIDWEHTAEQLSMGGASFHWRNGIHMMFDGI